MFHFFLISNFEQMQALAPLVKFTMVSVAEGTFLPVTLVIPRILSKYFYSVPGALKVILCMQ